MDNINKKIALNTGVMYVRLIVTTIIGLLTSRYVLLALGARDFGLYAVVGGLISLLNVLSTAMDTTTRRYINVEMGKPDGNLNRIFNVSRLIHIGFALFVFLIAETIGLFYIHNFLNVAPERFDDAIFIFHVSTFSAAMSIVNVPYQALMEAYEKFNQIACVDIMRALVKLFFVYCLMAMTGDVLRIYALGISLLTLFTLSFYNVACLYQWKDIVKYKFYKDSKLYKEILVFNNYVALGATSYIARTQASTMLVNYFFGTLVNAAFAIGYAIESYCITFVQSISTAAAPQITKNYFENHDRSIRLTEAVNRYSVYMLLLVFVPITVEMDFILRLWLNEVPEGTALVCHLTLISALTRIFLGSISKLVQASGRNKWFQISGSIIQLSCVPIAFILYKMDFPAITIIVLYILSSYVGRFVSFYLLRRILNFDVQQYVRNVYVPTTCVVLCVTIVIFLYCQLNIDGVAWKLLGMLTCVMMTMMIIYLIGLNSHEKDLIKKKIYSIINK